MEIGTTDIPVEAWTAGILDQSGIAVLLAAAVLDFLIGDPWGWPHPVKVMGWVIQGLTRGAWRWLQPPWILRLVGVAFSIIVIGGSGAIAWFSIQVAKQLYVPVGLGLEIILLASCFAGRSLRAAAIDVIQPLTQGDVMVARSRLRKYVGRDTENLSAPEMLRAVLETVAENTTDGVMAPLFYAGLGLLVPEVGPVPLAIAYKAASTLDSMVGYRAAPYREIGWFSARLEDGLTWLPCRCTVLTLGFVSGRLRRVLKLCRRDASKDPSPNAGWSECAFAAILGVQLGGHNQYRGVVQLKPLLGDPLHPITPNDIHLALRLTRNSFLLWLMVAVVLSELNGVYPWSTPTLPLAVLWVFPGSFN